MLGAMPENRLFFRALQRHTVGLSKRGCPKAAVGAATLLLSLDRTDPTKARTWLDVLCLRADEPAKVGLRCGPLMAILMMADDGGWLMMADG